MAKVEKHSHLTKRWNVWYARLTVPADVRSIIGRNIFIASTHERYATRANAVGRSVDRGLAAAHRCSTRGG